MNAIPISPEAFEKIMDLLRSYQGCPEVSSIVRYIDDTLSDNEASIADFRSVCLVFVPLQAPMVYIQNKPGLWTTGFYSPDGTFKEDEDFDTMEEAVKRVAWYYLGEYEDML